MAQPEPHQQLVDRLPIPVLGQLRFLEGLVEPGLQFRQPGLVERPVEIADRDVLAADLPGDQLVEEREAEMLVEPQQVGLHFAGPQEVDAGHQHAVGVEHRLGPLRLLLGDQLPLRGVEAPVMMIVVPGDAALGQRAQLVEELLAQDHDGREYLLQDVAVVAHQQAQVLAHVVADQFHLGAVVDGLVLQRLIRHVQAHHVAAAAAGGSRAGPRRCPTTGSRRGAPR